jgi:hypothetical protein
MLTDSAALPLAPGDRPRFAASVGCANPAFFSAFSAAAMRANAADCAKQHADRGYLSCQDEERICARGQGAGILLPTNPSPRETFSHRWLDSGSTVSRPSGD